MTSKTFHKSIFFFSFFLTILFTGCGDTSQQNAVSQQGEEGESLEVGFEYSAQSAFASVAASAEAIVIIESQDTIIKELTVERNRTWGTLENMPVGKDLQITVNIYSQSGVLCYRGDQSATVRSQARTQVNIHLYPANEEAGTVVISGTIHNRRNELDEDEDGDGIEDTDTTEETDDERENENQDSTEMVTFDTVSVSYSCNQVSPDQVYLMDNNTVAYWDFSQGDSTSIKDYSSNNFDGVLFNTKSTENGVRFFDHGSQSFANFPSIDSKLNPHELTISTVVKLHDYPIDGVSATLGGYSNWSFGNETYGFELRIDSIGRVEFVTGHADSYTWTLLVSEQSLELETWYDITAEFNHGQVSIFINGCLSGQIQEQPPINFSENEFLVGIRKPGTPDHPLSATINKMAVSNTARITSVDQHLSCATIDQEIGYSTDENTVAYWDFTSVDGNFIADLSAFENHGTLYNTQINSEGALFTDNSYESYASFPAIDSLLSPNELSITMKVKLHAYPLDGVSATLGGYSNWSVGNETYGYELRIDSIGRVEFVTGHADSYTWTLLVGEHVLDLDKWYEITAEYDNGKVSVYVNGCLSGQIYDQPPINFSYNNYLVGIRKPGTPNHPLSATVEKIAVSKIARF